MFKILYSNFYSFSKFIKENTPGSIFHDPAFDAIVLLSGFEFLNVASVVIYFRLGSLTNKASLDVLLGFIILLVCNYFIFVFKKRKVKLLTENSNTVLSSLFTLLYVVSSIIVFYNIHSGNWR